MAVVEDLVGHGLHLLDGVVGLGGDDLPGGLGHHQYPLALQLLEQPYAVYGAGSAGDRDDVPHG